MLDYNRTNDSIHCYETDCMLLMPIGLVCVPHSDDIAKFLMILNLLTAHTSLAKITHDDNALFLLSATYETPGVFSDFPISIQALDKVSP